MNQRKILEPFRSDENIDQSMLTSTPKTENKKMWMSDWVSDEDDSVMQKINQ